MQLVDDDVGKVTPVIWDAYKEIIRKYEPGVSYFWTSFMHPWIVAYFCSEKL